MTASTNGEAEAETHLRPWVVAATIAYANEAEEGPIA